MLTIAYTEMGLSVEEFERLSWYEWGLECLKLKKKNESQVQLWAFREFMALMANINRDEKKKREPFKGSDFFKLSFDRQEPEDKPVTRELTPEEIDKKFGKFLKK